MNEDLRHAAAELAIRSAEAVSDEEAKQHLQERFLRSDSVAIRSAYFGACELRGPAHRVAEMHRDEVFNETEALNQLREHCPGFAETLYSQALAQGLASSNRRRRNRKFIRGVWLRIG